MISAIASTRTRWRTELIGRGVSSVLECCSVSEAGSLLDGLGPQDVLVLLDATLAWSDGSNVSPVRLLDPSRSDRLVILGPPDPAVTLASLAWGARAVLFQHRSSSPDRSSSLDHGSSLDSDEATTATQPRAAHRAIGELGGHPVTAADGAPTWLTWREVEVLRHVADGLSNEQIGRLLGLSALTVKSHLARAARRLHARDRGHLVLLALRAGVIT